MIILVAGVLGIVIGAVMGALGGGGAILTVPILVYLLGQTAQQATASSLVIVGVAALSAGIGHARAGHVRWATGISFGTVGIAASWVGSQANRHVQEGTLLLGFALVTVIAAAAMLVRDPEPDGARSCPPASVPTDRVGSTAVIAAVAARDVGLSPATTVAAKIVAAGLAVGLLTGFFGVGGGFVIVPALVLALHLPMPEAVGTSLWIIAINSGAALIARADHATFDWAVIVPITITAMVGTVAGRRAATRVQGNQLTRAFAVLLLLVAAYTGVRSALSLW